MSRKDSDDNLNPEALHQRKQWPKSILTAGRHLIELKNRFGWPLVLLTNSSFVTKIHHWSTIIQSPELKWQAAYVHDQMKLSFGRYANFLDCNVGVEDFIVHFTSLLSLVQPTDADAKLLAWGPIAALLSVMHGWGRWRPTERLPSDLAVRLDPPSQNIGYPGILDADVEDLYGLVFQNLSQQLVLAGASVETILLSLLPEHLRIFGGRIEIRCTACNTACQNFDFGRTDHVGIEESSGEVHSHCWVSRAH
jgi:hypothetical protein